jgi:hypothetical protein
MVTQGKGNFLGFSILLVNVISGEMSIFVEYMMYNQEFVEPLLD